jgi:hypothetical protein
MDSGLAGFAAPRNDRKALFSKKRGYTDVLLLSFARI